MTARAARIAPSDVKRALVSRAEVGGRARRSRARWEITDAFASVGVTFAVAPGPSELEDGDLLVVEADIASAFELVNARVLERARPTDTIPRAAAGSGSDASRFSVFGAGARLELRARAIAALRALFGTLRFLEVETPMIVPCPGLDVHLDAFAVAGVDPPRFLITSPEYQMKRLLVGGVPRCFQIARSFRRAEIGARHNPEFTMLEWYRAFATLDEVIDDTERVVLAVRDAIGVEGSPLARMDLERPFPRLSVASAFERHAGVREDEMLDLANHDEETFFRLLVDRVEPALGSSTRPVVLERYPARMASLARLCPDDARYAERFELYVAGVELCNGFGELTDPVAQRGRFEADQRERRQRGLPVYPIDERFIAALHEGMPPSAGNALGLDRLVMLAVGADSIADVMAFPEGIL